MAKAEYILGEIFIKNIANIAIDMTENSVILFSKIQVGPIAYRSSVCCVLVYIIDITDVWTTI